MPKIVEVLTPEELVTRRRVMEAMYHREGMTYAQVGKAMGISTSRARQILVNANPKAWKRDAADRSDAATYRAERQLQAELEERAFRRRYFLRIGGGVEARRQPPTEDDYETLAQSTAGLIDALEAMRDHPDLPVGKEGYAAAKAEAEDFYREQGRDPPPRWWRRDDPFWGIYVSLSRQ